MQLSYRGRLILGFVLVIGATGLSATFIGAYLIGQRFVRQAQAKVAQDINSARVIYEHELVRLQDLARLTANRFSIRDAVRAKEHGVLARALQQVREAEKLDLLGATDGAGVVIVRAEPGAPTGDSLAQAPLLQPVLATKAPVAGTEVMTAAELARESPGLAARARIALVPTPHARPTVKTELAAAMVLVAAAPVLDEDGRLRGVIYGGRLLNHGAELVDRIKDTVYRGEQYQGRETGTATLFLGDTRIATTVRNRDGGRAIGTRIQAEVGDRLLRDGKPWTERAFVVNGWYLTAYEPVRDLGGRVVGVLYVGMREDEFVALERQTVLGFLAVTALGMALASVIAYFLARTALRPLGQLVLASRQISQGNFDLRVPERSRDEIGSLERAFNQMMDAIRARDHKLRATAEARIMRTANLASLGQLAASVAHEVNNPLSGILIYLRLMLKYMTQRPFPLERVDEMVAWLRAMETEGARCGRLVSGMLQLGRKPPMKIAPTDLNAILDKSVVLLEHRFKLGNVTVVRQPDPALPLVQCDAEQIQQTVMGMLLNAVEAMPKGGTITVETSRHPDEDAVLVSIADTGIGIAPEALDRLFDAFFTTKGDGKGVGLGLSIAHAIVRRHGGEIDVGSVPGKGATFTVTLPVRYRGRRGEDETGDEARAEQEH